MVEVLDWSLEDLWSLGVGEDAQVAASGTEIRCQSNLGDTDDHAAGQSRVGEEELT